MYCFFFRDFHVFLSLQTKPPSLEPRPPGFSLPTDNSLPELRPISHLSKDPESWVVGHGFVWIFGKDPPKIHHGLIIIFPWKWNFWIILKHINFEQMHIPDSWTLLSSSNFINLRCPDLSSLRREDFKTDDMELSMYFYCAGAGGLSAQNGIQETGQTLERQMWPELAPRFQVTLHGTLMKFKFDLIVSLVRSC